MELFTFHLFLRTMLTVTNATTGVARSAKKWYNKKKGKKRTEANPG